MHRLFVASLLSVLFFASFSGVARADSEEAFQMLRPRPRPTIYRCCAKPSNGVMNCSQGTDHVLTWFYAINNCERRYGSGNCVSGCRRL